MMDGMYGANPLFGYNNNNSNVGARVGTNDEVEHNELLQQELEQEINREEKRQQQLRNATVNDKKSRKRKDDDDDDDDDYDDDDDDTEEDDNTTTSLTTKGKRARTNNNDDSDDDDYSSSSTDHDSDDAKKKLKKKAKSIKQQQQQSSRNKNRQYALSNVKLRKKDKLHMKQLMRGIMKQAKQNEEEKLFKTITQTVLGTLNPASAAAAAAAADSPLLGQKRSRSQLTNDDDDNDDDDTNDVSSSSSYLKRARKHHDSNDGKFNSVAHKHFITDLQDKLTKFNNLGVHRIKELDTTHNLEDLPLTGKDKYMSNNSNTPTVTIKEPLFEILTDHYCKSVLVNSILRKVLPFVDIPYIKK